MKAPRVNVFLSLLLAGMGGTPLGAQAPAPPLTAQDRQAIVASLGQALRQRYVLPDVAEQAANAVDTALAAGTYDAIPDRAAFTARLSADVRAIAHDKHLDLWPEGSAPPSASASPHARPHHEQGIVRADRLAGGIGYIEIIGFPPKTLFQEAIDKAMSSLKGSRALIIDDRRNHGGSPASVAYLVSFLVAPGTPINDIVSRTQGTRDFTRESYRAVPTPIRFDRSPVFVLTSHETFSGGEELAYDLQALGRAWLVGEITGGGANPTMGVNLGHGVMSTIPFGRAENPRTGSNWEGHGVQPDRATSADDALKVALEQLGQKPRTTIEQASIQQVFTPRTAPRPASAQRLRQIIASYASGDPDYAAMTPDFAAQIRKDAPHLQAILSPLGDIKTLRFLDIDQLGGDRFEVSFAHGLRIMAIILAPDGKVLATSDPVPPQP
jgi:hypothetical protein